MQWTDRIDRRLNPRDLHIFRVVVEHGNISKAADSLAISRQQYQTGGITYLSLLTAQQTYQQARINLAVAQGNRYSDTAALFQALGGGWWHRTDVAATVDGDGGIAERDRT